MFKMFQQNKNKFKVNNKKLNKNKVLKIKFIFKLQNCHGLTDRPTNKFKKYIKTKLTAT